MVSDVSPHPYTTDVINKVAVVDGDAQMVVAVPNDIKGCHRAFSSLTLVDREAALLVGETFSYQVMAKFSPGAGHMVRAVEVDYMC